jgi:hypothetical protein
MRGVGREQDSRMQRDSRYVIGRASGLTVLGKTRHSARRPVALNWRIEVSASRATSRVRLESRSPSTLDAPCQARWPMAEPSQQPPRFTSRSATSWLLPFVLLAGCGRIGVEVLPWNDGMDAGGAGDSDAAYDDALAMEDAASESDAAETGVLDADVGVLDPCLDSCVNPNGSAECVSGRCVLRCDTSYADCDGIVTNGCEADIERDPAHCGGCGTPCASNAQTCVSGMCETSPCVPGQGECDNDLARLCETDLTSSQQNCGFCGNACVAMNGTSACSAGACVVTQCNPTHANCDGSASNGCETPLNTATNCGMCGRTCPANGGTPGCAAGTCTTTCDMTGRWALRISVPSTWPGTSLLSAGSGNFTFWGLLQLTQSGTSLTGTLTMCGETAPDFRSAPFINEQYGIVFPNALFDRNPPLPAVAAGGGLTSASPGSQLTFARTALLAGASMANPINDPWPSAAATMSLDSDADGKPAVSALYKTGSGYAAPPVNDFGTVRAQTDYIAARMVFSLAGTLDSCSTGSGTATPQDIDYHTLGCRITGNARDCSAAEASHLDQNAPDFRPTPGPYALAKLASGATCASVRAALP